MTRISRNPEFVRHLRGNLRPTRSITVLVTTGAICALVWLGCYSSVQSELAMMRSAVKQSHWSDARLNKLEQNESMEVWLRFYRFMMYAQLGMLTFWSLLSCAQSISGERERRTWDFQRATRMGPGELLVGKLLGEPVVAYFIVVCCLPITALAAILGRAGWRNLASAYVLVLSAALFIGLVGLWLSNLFESRSRGIGLIGTFGIYLLLGLATSLRSDSSFPGLAGFSPLAGMLPLLSDGVSAVDRANGIRGTIFGAPTPWPLISLLLYVTFGAWLVLVLLRTLKEDFEQTNALSRWEVVGCAAFLGFTIYALFRPGRWEHFNSVEFAKIMVALNGFVLFGMGLAMLSPSERLKVWWRSRRRSEWVGLFTEDGLASPWLALSVAVGYGTLVWGMYVWKYDVGFDREGLLAGLLLYFVVGVFLIRDILFLQWCRLTKLRAPVVKGFLYVGLYYVASTVLAEALAVGSEDRSKAAYALLTPAGAFYTGQSWVVENRLLVEIAAGVGIQFAVISVLMSGIVRRLKEGK